MFLSKKMRVLMTTFVMLIITDGLMTLWAVNNGYKEVNPLMAPVAASPLFLVFKVVSVLLIVAAAWFFIRRFPRLSWIVAIALGSGIVCYALVITTNLWELL